MPRNILTKYTWFGPGYVSSMYYRYIANQPMYNHEIGGDMSFQGPVMYASGDADGKPRRQHRE